MALSELSDLAFEAALAGYVMALVCFGVEFASGRATEPTAVEAASVARRAADRSRTAVLDRPAIGHVQASSRPVAPWGVRFGRAGVVVTLIGFAAHVLSIVCRGLAAGRVPWGNMYEFTAMICAAIVLGFLVQLALTGARTVGFFVMVPVVILMYIDQSLLYISINTLKPALHSTWLVIHVLAVSLSSGVLLLSGIASAAYLVRHRYESKLEAENDWASEHPGVDADQLVAQKSRVASLPSLATLDRLAYRTAIVAFPVFTFAVIAGAMWANVSWGRYWGWDPKETSAFVTWVLFACYLHARSTAGWRGVRSAWIAMLGSVSVIFNLFVINLVVPGLHSYSGLN